MDNCLQKKSAQLLKNRTPHRLLAGLFVFVMILTGAQAENYYWVGGGTDNDWTTIANWATSEGGTGGDGITQAPGASDTVYIFGEHVIEINSAISINKLFVSSTANALTSNFTTKLSGSGSLSVASTDDPAINIERCSSAEDVTGTLEINLPLTCSGTIHTHSGTTLKVDSGKTLTATGIFHSASGGSPLSKIDIAGTLNVGTGTIALSNGNPGTTQLVVTGSVNAGTIECNVTAYNNTSNDGSTTIVNPIVNNGTITVSDSFTIPAYTNNQTGFTPYSGNGTIKLDGANAKFINNDTNANHAVTVAALQGLQACEVNGGGNTTFTEATFSSDITLSGANTFGTFTATGLADKTLTVNADQTIQTSISLSGTSGHPLTVTGDAGAGDIKPASIIVSGDYLTIDTDSHVVSSMTATAYAKNSTTTGSGTANWAVASGTQHIWKGGTAGSETVWHTAANWLPQSVPSDTDVIINAGAPYPVISSDVEVNSIELNGVAELSVSAGANLTIKTGTELNEAITGEGTLILDSGENFTVTGDKSFNINIKNQGNLDVTGDLTLKKNFTDTGTVTQTSGKKLIFNGTEDQVFTVKATTQYRNIELTKTSGDFKTSGTLKADSFTATTNVSISEAAIETTGDTFFNGTVTSSNSLSVKAANLSFDGAAAVKDITLEATTTTTSSDITVTGDWTNNGTFTAASPSTVIFTTDDDDAAYATITGNNTFYDLEIRRNININDNTTVHNFTANRKESAATTNMGGRNIIFAANTKLTVGGSLNLKGNSNQSEQRLRLAGTNPDSTITPWELECTDDSASHSIQYISFKGCTNSSASPLVLTDCTDQGGNEGYVFLGQKYTWVGGSTGHLNDWKWGTNWNPQSIPGKGAEIIIPKNKQYYPIISYTDIDIDNGDTANATAAYGTITIEAGNATEAAGQLDLANYNIKAKKITNNGILKLTGAAGQEFKRTNGTTATVMENGTNSTVEYYGTGINPTNFAWDGDNGAGTDGLQYANLILAQSSSSASTTKITVSKDLTINAAAALLGELDVTGKTILAAGSGNAVTLGNTSNVFRDGITLGLEDSNPAVAFNAGAVTLKSAGEITIDDKANAQSFDCYSAVKIKNITTSGNQTYREDVTLLSTATFTTTVTSSTIDFQKDIKGTGFTLTLASAAGMSNASATIEPTIQTQTGKSFTPSSGTTTFKANVLLADSTVNATSGTVILTGENAELRGSNTFFGLELQNSTKITGSNGITNFTVNSAADTGLGDKTITFTAATTQTIAGTGTLTLKGNSPASRLKLYSGTVNSAWNITYNGSSSVIQYVDVQDSNNGSNDFLIAGGTPTDTTPASWDRGNNTKWHFPGMAYEWEASAANSNWNDKTNWSPASVPGIGTKIKINAAGDNYPNLSTLTSAASLDLSGGTYTAEILVDTGATFDIADKSLILGTSTSAGTITNKGTVLITGSSTQTISNTKMVNSGTASTVKYEGTSATAKLLWDGDNGAGTAGNQYTNLIINNSNGTSVATATDLVISGNFTVNENLSLTGSINATGTTAAITIDKNCTNLSTSGDQTYNGAVSIASTTTSEPTISSSAGKLSFNNSLTLAQDLTLSATDVTNGGVYFTDATKNVSGNKILTISSGTKPITFDCTAGTTTASLGQLVITNTTTGLLTFNKGGVLGNNFSYTAGTTSLKETLKVTGTVETGALTLTGTTKIDASTSITFKGNINGTAASTTLETVGAVFIDGSCSTITTSGNQIYNNAVTVQSTATSAPAISSTSGSLTFKNSLTLNKDLSLTATNAANGGVSFTNASANVSSAANTLTISSGTKPITFSGTAGTTAAKLNQLVITGTTGNLTFSKGGYLGSDFSYTGGLINLTNSFSVTGSLKTAALTTTGTATISTTTTQNYTGAVNSATLNLDNATDITFGSTVNASTLSIKTAASTSFNGSVTISNFKDDASHTGAISFNKGGSITTIGTGAAGTIYTNGTVSIGDSTTPTLTLDSNFTHTAGPTNITGILTATGKNIYLANTTGTPVTINCSNLILSGSFGSTSGNGTANLNCFVQLSPSSNADFGNVAAVGTTHDTINISENLIITGSSTAGITIKGKTNVSENLVLYKGPVTANADINVTKDILVLGNETGHPYSETNNTTGVANEYSYIANRSSLSWTEGLSWSEANYIPESYPNLPDGSSLPATSTYSATLSVVAGTTISAGKNFYANGTSLTGTGTWKLQLPDLTTPTNGFAEAYHSVVSYCNVICNGGTSTQYTDGSKARLVTLDCTEGVANSNHNVDFDEFIITAAYTVRDNAIRINFNRPVRFHSHTIENLKFHDQNDNANGTFTGFFSQPDCTSSSSLAVGASFPHEEIAGTTYYYCYIQASNQNSSPLGAWNTDATGKNGEPNSKSSDRNGVHHTTRPCLDFPRALSTMPFILTDIWGKRLNNYSVRPSATATEPAYGGTGSTHDVEDKTGPVLWTVRTGQELHSTYDSATGEASQHSYDSHNFLEFRYSEPVTFNSDSIPNNAVNIQVTNTFGAIQENIATSTPQTLSFAGLAKIQNSVLYTGSNGSANKFVNALYRTDDYSIRLSIAGWTDGTVTDYAGNEYKKWPGYIEAATQFKDKLVTSIADPITHENTFVKDMATTPNSQIEYPVNSTEPVVKDNSTGLLETPSPDTYSPWDLSSPVFTPLRFSKETEWGEQEMSEAIGNTNGSGSTLDRIDFHFFDNTPAYSSSDAAEWFTEIGWCNPGSEASKANLKASDYSYAADIIGGARPFASDAVRTTGGIRFSTKANISPAFKYSTSPNNPSPSTDFQTGIANLHTTVVSQLFTGSSAPMRPANDPDGLYLGLGLSDSNLSVDTTFAFSYNESLGYLTDLAGNRLRSKTSKTIDRTPPSFDVIISPVDSKSIYIIFVKQIVTDSSKVKFRDDSGTAIFNTPYPDFTNILPRCFRIISIDAGGNTIVSTENQIDTSVPAEIIENFSNDSFTCIKLATTKEIDIESLKNCYVQLITPAEYPQTGSDPLTNNTGSRVTLIQDYLGNYMSMYSAHALSDFAVNYVNPLYAYSTDMIYEDESIMNGLYEAGSWAVHDWNADQQNYGTLPAGYPVSIVADTKANDKIRIYLSPSPDAESVSSQMNTDFGTNFRIWLPDLTDGSFRALAAANNTNFVYTDGSLTQENSANSIFNLSKETVSAWENKSQISFMFGLMEDENNPVRIYNNPYYDVSTDKFNLSLSIPVPLYSLRMQDTTDLNTLDLWSFKIKAITSQRGGVTILNNVINASNEEKTVVIVDMPEDGNLTVCVMTLDGNIITYLNRGNTKAGEYYYTWNGKNRNGKAVARGMYFVRVLGGGIDETRKVMVVK